MLDKCNVCPRGCLVDRSRAAGFCGASDKIAVSRVALHEWEEPCISGSRGSGTIFFAGCNLRCVFCQNKTISASREAFSGAREMTPAELASAMLSLQNKGAHNINLVTPTHYAPLIKEALVLAKPRLDIPVVYNTSGYESTATIRSLSGLVDIYLPDLKYFSSELSGRYSSAPDYFRVAREALTVMFSQVGEAEFYDNGMMKRGMIVRHLILPSCRKDSIALISELAAFLPVEKIKLSLMRQFTPDFVDGEKYPELCRRLTSFEYDSVVRHASSLGFDGYVQSAQSASSAYTPKFNTPDAFLNETK